MSEHEKSSQREEHEAARDVAFGEFETLFPRLMECLAKERPGQKANAELIALRKTAFTLAKKLSAIEGVLYPDRIKRHSLGDSGVKKFEDCMAILHSFIGYAELKEYDSSFDLGSVSRDLKNAYKNCSL